MGSVPRGESFGMRTILVLVILAILPMPTADAHADPIVYAHRGGAALAPENTLGAFRQAHELFADRGVWLELDTQLTSDGVPVVIHDDTLDRTTPCEGAVIEHTVTEVTACDASEAFPGWGTIEAVPTLEQVLVEGREGGWRLMVEIKDIPGEANFEPLGMRTAEALVALVAETGFPKENLLVQSFWPPALDHTKRLDPDLRTALLTTSRLVPQPPGVGFYATENAAFSKARGYDVVAPDHTSPDLSAEVVTAIHGLGLDVVVWTPNVVPDIERAISWGLDGIISDHPDRVYAALDG